MGKGLHLSAAQPRRRVTARDRRSAGAATARVFVRIPKPAAVYVEIDAAGGSEAVRVKKSLRKGDLSAAASTWSLFEEEVVGGAEAGEAVVGLGGGDVVGEEAGAAGGAEAGEAVVGLGDGDVVGEEAGEAGGAEAGEAVVGLGGSDVICPAAAAQDEA